MFTETVFAQQGSYQSLVPEIQGVANQLSGGTIGSSGNNLNALLNQWVYIIIGAAVVLAIFMIIRGGYLYMTSSDNANKKTEAKNRIKAALGGLLLALGAVLILNTINPSITQFTIEFPSLNRANIPPEYDVDGDGVVSEVEALAFSRGISVTEARATWDRYNAAMANLDTSGMSRGEINAYAATLAAQMGLPTSHVPGTEGGNLACVYAVNGIGRYANGGSIDPTLSTASLNESLANNPNYVQVSWEDRQPGDIWVAPTEGSVHGHTGVFVMNNGQWDSVDNSSSRGRIDFLSDRTDADPMTYIQSRFERRGLDVNVYRPR